LAAQRIAHASIDLDALGGARLTTPNQDKELMYRNLRSVWQNYARVGVRRLVLARAIEERAELECCCNAVSASAASGVKVSVCRLTASMKTMQARVQTREIGQLQNTLVARVPELDAILDRAHLEDFSLLNENRPVTEVAHEMLVRAGWL